MKKISILSLFILTASFAARAQTGHLPFEHSHSSECGQTGGVCYGYAMGVSGGGGSAPYSACDPATIIPAGSCSNPSSWLAWNV
jgi:hypothetical protein